MSDFKIAHVSDVHAGYKATRRVNSKGLNIREADGYVAFSRIITEIIDEDVDAVLIAGDIFHVPKPEVRTQVFVQKQLLRLWRARIPVYMLAGNHDTNDVKTDVAASKLLDDPWRKIFSHVEPYAVHEIGDGIHLHMVSHHMYSEQHETMKKVVPVDGAINIFSTHGSVIDPLTSLKLTTENSPREIIIPDSLFSYDWDYTMLGHIHERGWVGSKDESSDTEDTRIFYNGSIIRRGFSDSECALGRGWTLWSIDSSGNFTPSVRTIPQRPQIDFGVIDAADLKASEVTSKVLANLQETQSNGREFDVSSAPILRQRVVNLSPSKSAGIDRNAIETESGHSLSWNLETPVNVDSSVSKDSGNNQKSFENKDLIASYDRWAEESQTLKSVDEDMRETVQQQTRDFVEMGVQYTLDKESS